MAEEFSLRGLSPACWGGVGIHHDGLVVSDLAAEAKAKGEPAICRFFVHVGNVAPIEFAVSAGGQVASRTPGYEPVTEDDRIVAIRETSPPALDRQLRHCQPRASASARGV